LHKISVLVVSSAALSQLIRHILRGGPEFEVVGSIGGFKNLGQWPRPELIVVNVKPVGTAICQAVAAIKESSPASKVIVVCPVRDFARVARRCGADAYLSHESLVGHLLRKARSLSTRPQLASFGN
jgi:hypothetical protein